MAGRTKLLVVSSALGGGGAERITATLLDRLDRGRFQPSLCLLQPVVSYPLPDDVPVTVLGEQGGLLARELRRRPWRAVGLLRALRRHIEASEADVVLSNADEISSLTGAALLGARRRPRWVARAASDPGQRRLSQRLSARWLLPRADAVVVSSQRLAGELARRYPGSRSRLRCIPNPVDCARIDELAAAEPRLRRRPGVPVVVAVGRLGPEKRVDLMVDAIEAVRRRHPAQLWLCGDGPLAAATREQVRRRGLDGAVELLGFCDNPYALMSQADLFLLASDTEGMPNSLLEAQALGIAAVSTDCRFGPREVIADGETGLLVPPGDSAALAGAITALLDDPARRQAMGAAARRRVRARFGVDALLGAWQELLAGT